MPKLTPAQRFHNLFKRWATGSTEAERATGERKVDEWLARNGKTRADIAALLAEAHADELKANPPPPPPDPRDSAPHPYDDPRFTPAGLVEGIVKKYVAMSEHVSTIVSLWTPFTHVYMQFAVAPRVVVTSKDPVSGKSTLRRVLSHLVCRPNRASLSSVPLLVRFLDRGPGTVMLDEVDHTDPEAQPKLIRVWNEGFERGSEIGLLIGGEERFFNIYAPMLVAGLSKGIGKLLMRSQLTRAFMLDLERYTEQTRPERNYRVTPYIEELNAVYSYLRHFATNANLNPDPAMPLGVDARLADDLRGLISIADFCGEEWGWRAREAASWLLAKEKAELPDMVILKHGLAIFDMPGIGNVTGPVFDRELLRLDLPGMDWRRYRGAGGGDTAHPITPAERGDLLRVSHIEAKTIRPSGAKPYRGFLREWFVQALRERESEHEPVAPHLRLITPKTDGA
jgi:hypothetical protein